MKHAATVCMIAIAVFGITHGLSGNQIDSDEYVYQVVPNRNYGHILVRVNTVTGILEYRVNPQQAQDLLESYQGLAAEDPDAEIYVQGIRVLSGVQKKTWIPWEEYKWLGPQMLANIDEALSEMQGSLGRIEAAMSK